MLVKPGAKVPTDGVILEGRTKVNQALLTARAGRSLSTVIVAINAQLLARVKSQLAS